MSDRWLLFNEETSQAEIKAREFLADAWAFNALLPVRWVKHQLSNGIFNVKDLAKLADISPEFARAAMTYYKDINAV